MLRPCILLDILFDFSSLANSVTQVVKLGSSDFALADHFHLLQVGGMDRESLFYAYAVGYAANGECLLDAAVLHSDDGALKDLNSFTVAFFDLGVHPNGVADAEVDSVRLQLGFGQFFYEIHNSLSFRS